MANSTHSINLVSNREEGLLTEFLTWLLSIGRILIILTELIALGVFIYRFSLDLQISNLHDKIKQDTATLSTLKARESIYRDIQQRLSFSKQYDMLSDKTPSVLRDIITMGTGYVTFQSILVQADLFRIEVQAPNTAYLSAFVNKLKTYPKFTNVSLDNIKNKSSSATIVITISAGLTLLPTEQTKGTPGASVQQTGL